MNGCFNRHEFRPGYYAQDGWYMDGYTRTPKMIWVPFRMSQKCEYMLDQLVGKHDNKCAGCKWKGTNAANH